MKLNHIFSWVMLVLVLSLIGCSPEAVVKKATDGAVNVDKDGNVVIKDQNGDSQVIIGKTDWDQGKMFGLEAPKATLEGVISSDQGTSYTFVDMKEKDAKAYIESIKAAGFTFDYFSADDFSYSGTNQDGGMISFIYTKEDGSGLITATQGEKPTEDQGGTTMINENAKWDTSLIGDLPDPGVAISQFIQSDKDVSYYFDPLDQPKDYAKLIKEKGFTVDPMEVDSPDNYLYNAKNSNGDSIFFNATTDGCYIVYTKAN